MGVLKRFGLCIVSVLWLWPLYLAARGTAAYVANSHAYISFPINDFYLEIFLGSCGLLASALVVWEIAWGGWGRWWSAIIMALIVAPFAAAGVDLYSRLRTVYGNGIPWPARHAGDTVPVLASLDRLLAVFAWTALVVIVVWVWRVAAARAGGRLFGLSNKRIERTPRALS